MILHGYESRHSALIGCARLELVVGTRVEIAAAVMYIERGAVLDRAMEPTNFL